VRKGLLVVILMGVLEMLDFQEETALMEEPMEVEEDHLLAQVKTEITQI
jgi:hypothetical protein